MSELRNRLAERAEPRLESSPMEAAWLVLEAASDLGDESAVAVCRRVIDASLNGRSGDPADLVFVQNYFR